MVDLKFCVDHGQEFVPPNHLVKDRELIARQHIQMRL
jgi:hypothetical protein